MRKGPNKPGLVGLLVPFSDAIKLIGKEVRFPNRRNFFFCLVPCISLTIPLVLWCLYPSRYWGLRIKYSALVFLCVASVGVYALLRSGWRSNSKYRQLGSIRAIAQSVSYEVRFSLILLHYILFFSFDALSLGLEPLLFMIIPPLLFFVSALAESNRAPFDFSEGESELVRGFNTEYSSVHFVMIFLAEYLRILFLSVMTRLLFLRSGLMDLWIMALFVSVAFIWSRASLPRLRYDQLMILAWKAFLPTILRIGCLFLLTYNLSSETALWFRRRVMGVMVCALLRYLLS